MKADDKPFDPFAGIEAAPFVDDPDDHIRPSDFALPDDQQPRIYLVWAVGTYPNGVRLLDLRAVTGSKGKAILYSRMMRRDKEPGELWERIVIEPRVLNHLYGESWREFRVNTGRM